MPGNLVRIADGHLATVHGFLELGRTLHLDGVVFLHHRLTDTRHLRDLLADPSPLGGIPPNGIHGRRSTLSESGSLSGHRFRFQSRPGDFEPF